MQSRMSIADVVSIKAVRHRKQGRIRHLRKVVSSPEFTNEPPHRPHPMLYPRHQLPSVAQLLEGTRGPRPKLDPWAAWRDAHAKPAEDPARRVDANGVQVLQLNRASPRGRHGRTSPTHGRGSPVPGAEGKEFDIDSTLARLRDELASQWSTVRHQLQKWDADQNGVIDRSEWCLALPVALRMVGQISMEDCGRLFDYLDADRSGTLEYAELHRYLRAGAGVKLDARLREGAVAFDKFVDQKHSIRTKAKEGGSNVLGNLNLDGADGETVIEALSKALAGKLGRVVDLFREWDEDGSGAVDYREFGKAMKELGVANTALEQKALFDALDEDGEGELEYREIANKLKRARKKKKRKEGDGLREPVRLPPIPQAGGRLPAGKSRSSL